MSDLFRQSVNNDAAPQTRPPRPRPEPITLTDTSDEQHYSSSSDSSASSAASINTVRPSSREQAAPETHWTTYFTQELYLEKNDESQRARYHVYLTPPADIKKGPLFICHHGAGSSALSFALLAQEIRSNLPEAGILSLSARYHGSTVTNTEGEESTDFSLDALASDALAMINLTVSALSWPSLPPSILVGHSLGGAIVTRLAADRALGTALLGFCVLDVVEGSALEAISHMQTYLSSRPASFPDLDAAIHWHLRTRTLRNPTSAAVSVPSLLTPTQAKAPNPAALTWLTPLTLTSPYWPSWFTGMSSAFLSARGAAKLLILAGTDRLDKDLMIGQMQGKFQLSVIPEAGHFVQEDVPEKTAGLLVEFFRRNDRSAMVLPPKVAELIRMGKKV